MILYTSGTTSRRSGVVTTYANIAAQTVSPVEAGNEKRPQTVLACRSPHGIVNGALLRLWSGARVTSARSMQVVWDYRR
jgi:acyl-CoA synthetase (AMP-forming)/AMP-acid ligase II